MRKTLTQTLLAAFLAILAERWMARDTFAADMGGGSMIAAAHHSMIADRWKNPYITDGLVYMWDAEWNAGGGKHDSSPRVIDCVNGIEMTFDKGPVAETLSVEVSSQHLTIHGAVSVFPAATDSSVRAVLAQSPLTIEMRRSYDISGSHIRPYIPYTTWQNGGYDFYLGDGIGGNGRASFNQSNIKTPSQINGTVSFVITGSSIDAYSNGDLVTSKTPTAATQSEMSDILSNSIYKLIGSSYIWGDFSYYGEFGFFRAYSRALSASEVAANYQIDKARFGLT